MKKRLITSIFIVLATVLAIVSKLLPHHVGDYIFDIFVLVIALVSALEISLIFEKINKPVNRLLVILYPIINYAILLLCLNIDRLFSIVLVEILALVIYFVLIAVIEGSKQKSFNKGTFKLALNSILACVYPSFLVCLFLQINHIDAYAGVKYFSIIFIIMVFAITMLTDSLAYVVGSTLHGPKLAPKISPNKTISGSIGGLFGGIAGALLVFLLATKVSSLSVALDMYNLQWWHFALIGLFGSVVGQAGDLFESKLKRMAGVKDSGNIFPGHGGMMDRVDAMTFVATFMFIVVLCIVL